MNKITATILGAGVALGGVLSPIIPNEMSYLYSCETVAFNTPTGELGDNEYAVTEKGRYIIKNVGDENNCSPITQVEELDTKGMIEVQVEGFKTYSGFKGTEKVDRVAPLGKYTVAKRLEGYKEPSKTEYESIIESILTPNVADAAIARNAVSSSTCSTCTSLSWTHTTAGANTALYVSTAVFDDTSAAERDIASVKYNSITLTDYASSTVGNIEAEIHYQVAPTTGANTVLITAGGTNDFITGIATTYTGVTQTSPIEVTNKATGFGKTPSTSCTTVTANDWVHDALVKYNTTEIPAVGAGQTENAKTVVGSGFGIRGGSSYETTTSAGAVTMSYSWATTDRDWAIICVGFKESVSASAVYDGGTILFE